MEKQKTAWMLYLSQEDKCINTMRRQGSAHRKFDTRQQALEFAYTELGKQEIWHGHTSKIVRVKDMELLTNETPFTDAEVLEALNEKWFALGNENIRLANNAGARMRRAKQKGVA